MGALFVLTALVTIITRESSVSLEILRVYEITTPVIEVGADLEIAGDGFAQGQRATVTLEGKLHRAGREADSVRVETRALAVSRDRLVARVDRAFERSLVPGRGGHATFHGDVVVSFASEVFGRSTLVGRRRGVVLEVRSPGSDVDQRALLGELQRFSHLIGLATRYDDATRELIVARVEPTSRASNAGLTEGDVIASVAGVRVYDATDAVPPPLDRVSMTVLRGDPRSEVPIVVDARGYATSWPREAWACLFVLLGLGALYFVLAMSRGPSPAWIRATASEIHLRISRVSLAALRSRGVATFAAAIGVMSLVLALGAHRIDVVLVVGVDGALAASALFARRLTWNARGAAVALFARAFAVVTLVTVSGCATLGELALANPRLPVVELGSLSVTLALAAWVLGGAVLASALRPSLGARAWGAFDALLSATLFIAPLPLRAESRDAVALGVVACAVAVAAFLLVRYVLVRALASALPTWSLRFRVVLLAIVACAAGALETRLETRLPTAAWRVIPTYVCLGTFALAALVFFARATKELWFRRTIVARA